MMDQSLQANALAKDDVSRVRFGVFEMDFRSGELFKVGRLVHLPPQPFRLLELLVRRPGAVVSREEIKDRLWTDGTVVDFDQGLNSCIYQIRGILNDDADVPRFVETLPRRGYRWVGAVEAVPAGLAPPRPSLHLVTPGEDAGVRTAEPEPPPQPAVPAARPPAWRALALLAGVGLAAAAGYQAAPDPESKPLPRWQRATFQRGLVTAARFAAGGEILSIAAWRSGPFRLYRSRPSIPGETALQGVPDGVQSLAGLSPAGEVAYVDAGPRPSRGGQLVRLPLTGGAPRVVADGVTEADWEPRSDAFALVRTSGSSAQLEYPVGVRLAQVADVSSLRVSPDSRLVAIAEHPVPYDDAGRVCVFERGRPDQQPRVVADELASLQGLAWSPRGDEVWFTATREGSDLALMAASLDGRLRAIAPATGRLTIRDTAPDGRVLLDRGLSRSGILYQQGESYKDLSWFDGSVLMALSRDGRQVAFIESGEAGGRDYTLFLRNVDGSPAVRIGPGRAFDISPDGRFVLATSKTGASLSLQPTGAGQARSLGDPRFVVYPWASFHPDGGRVFFTAREAESHPSLYVQDLNAGPPRLVSAGFIAKLRTVLAPDGQLVHGFCEGLDGDCLQPTDGGPPLPAPYLSGRSVTGWDRTGRKVFTRPDGRRPPVEIQAIDIETGRTSPLRTLDPSTSGGVLELGNVFTARGGEAVAYTYHYAFSELYVVSGLE